MPAAPSSSSPVAARVPPRRVVLLDDNPDHRELIAEYLEAELQGVEVLAEPGAGAADVLLVSESWRRRNGERGLPAARHCLALGDERQDSFLQSLREQVAELLEPSPAAAAVPPEPDPRLVCALAAAALEAAGPVADLLAPFAPPAVAALDPGALLATRLEAWRERWPGRRIVLERGESARLALAPGLWLGVFDTVVDQALAGRPAGEPLVLVCGRVGQRYRLCLEGSEALAAPAAALARVLAGIHGGAVDSGGGLVVDLPLPESSPLALDGSAGAALVVAGAPAAAELIAVVEATGRRAVSAADVDEALSLLEVGCRYELGLVAMATSGPGLAALQRADPGMLLITWGEGSGPLGSLHLSRPPEPRLLAELLG